MGELYSLSVFGQSRGVLLEDVLGIPACCWLEFCKPVIQPHVSQTSTCLPFFVINIPMLKGMWEVDAYNQSTNSIDFGRGGFQDSRGSLYGRGGDWFVENVFEEFDSPNEFFWDKPTQQLYYFHNGTGPPPASSAYEVPMCKVLVF
jgi:hypothetical protein